MNYDHNNPFSKQSAQVQPTDFDPVACKECGNAAFDQYYKLYKLSALKSPTGKSQLYNVPIFVCANCNAIYDPNKEDDKTKEDEKTKLTTEEENK